MLHTVSPKLEHHPEAVVPFHDCSADLLMLAGGDDQLCHSVHYAKEAARLMTRAGKTNFEVIVEPSAGHLCNTPYCPPTSLSRHPSLPDPSTMFVEVGGPADPAGHVRAQTGFWERTIDFFKKKL